VTYAAERQKQRTMRAKARLANAFRIRPNSFATYRDRRISLAMRAESSGYVMSS
jgi:hypothetical protein